MRSAYSVVCESKGRPSGAHCYAAADGRQSARRKRKTPASGTRGRRCVLGCRRGSDGDGVEDLRELVRLAVGEALLVVAVADDQREGERRLAVDHLLPDGVDFAPARGLLE